MAKNKVFEDFHNIGNKFVSKLFSVKVSTFSFKIHFGYFRYDFFVLEIYQFKNKYSAT
jgi:hypothetical protein